MKEIRIGLVGSGWMGKAHSSALADAEMLFGPDYGVASFEIVADANEEAAKSAQKKIGFKRITTDWHDVVTDPNVDLVDIATPNAFHYEVAKAALENGKKLDSFIDSGSGIVDKDSAQERLDQLSEYLK